MKRFVHFAKAVYYYLYCSYRIWRVRRKLSDDVVYTTARGVEIRVYPGDKSPHDFHGVTHPKPIRRLWRERSIFCDSEGYVERVRRVKIVQRSSTSYRYLKCLPPH